MDSFRRHVLDRLRVVYLGERKYVAVSELERFVEREATSLGGQR